MACQLSPTEEKQMRGHQAQIQHHLLSSIPQNRLPGPHLGGDPTLEGWYKPVQQ